eukprot:1297309-Pyramimonas_sp.AAC.2
MDERSSVVVEIQTGCKSTHLMVHVLHGHWQGIHVAHVVIDGPVDGEFVRSLIPEHAAQVGCTLPPLGYS